MLISVLVAAGCAHPPAQKTTPQPAILEAVPGSTLHKVTLTPAAEAALEVRIVPARLVGGSLVIPASAVVYDPKGVPWAYLVVGPRTYLREAIDVDHVSGGDAVLRSGPAPGSQVVAIGVSELLGAEYGVGEE